ncbi:NAD-dependent epimerase/dehydratase family protein [Aquipuribacter nitratireducens]|uniref:NAD-dependent epimerase/dehydratase family protein n=1 Tax=Aquipuribacter nitratireducens TaxID=650104 RepID=A0ABW0GHU5_9MICO
MSGWVVLGGSGFVGAAVLAAARAAGHDARALPAPRLVAPVGSAPQDLLALARGPAATLAPQVAGADVVVNAAGLATPGAPASPELTGADALLPGVVVLAAGAAGVPRVVHLSSAAVQGERAVLDASDVLDPRTPYARAKADGERVVALARAHVASRVVLARATSVQGTGRGTTEQLARLARSPLSSVAGAGDDPVPVTSAEGLGRWVVGLATADDPPAVALQPGEGWTTASLLRHLGGREPHHLPVPLARALVRVGYATSRLLGGRGRAAVRRVELVWFGQRQV